MKTEGLAQAQRYASAYGQRFEDALFESAVAGGEEVEQYEKESHRWRNRTGAAERELTCTAVRVDGKVVVINSHGVPYGGVLERRYPILREALRKYWPKILKNARALARSRGAG